MFDGGVFRGPLGPELGPAWSTALTAGSVVCAVLAIASFAVGFSFLIVAILVAESMLLCAVYLAYRAVAPNDVDLEQQSAGYLASVICLLLIISSVAFGLSFLVVPIVIGELLLLGGVYLTPSHPGFTSAAHTEDDVQRVLEVSEQVLAQIKATEGGSR
jgi:hypothetical protein